MQQLSKIRTVSLMLVGACVLLSAQQSLAAEVSDLLKDVRAARRVTREGTSLVKQIKSITTPITAKRKDNLPSDSQNVVFYSASWCGYCNKARAYMDENNVAYVEYDTETSAKGREDYATLGSRGVPVMLIGDERMEGWSESKFRRLYKQLQSSGSQPRSDQPVSGPVVVDAKTGVTAGKVLAAKIDNVAIFSSNKRDSEVVARLKKAEEVVAIETGTDEMVKVESASGSGWVDGRLFTLIAE